MRQKYGGGLNPDEAEIPMRLFERRGRTPKRLLEWRSDDEEQLRKAYLKREAVMRMRMRIRMSRMIII